MKKLFVAVTAIVLCSAAIAQNPVKFDANFEGGSLGEVEFLDSARIIVRPGDTVEHLSYYVHGRFDPANPVDVTLEPSANWYYFRVTGIKGKRLYLYMPDNGLRGTAYSCDGEKWDHLPINESYRHFIDKRFKSDTLFLAMFDPYTYSYHLRRMSEWEARPDVEVDTIGYSKEGRPLQLMHITDASVPAEKKARVWIHGRIHPSETPGSWLLDGLVEQLTGESQEAKSIRRQIDFYILPFINPDGVANGLSRSNPTGVNQEINYGRSEDSTVVEIKAVKAALERLTAERPFDIVLNNHSQQSDFATFWMHRGETSSMEYQAKQWALTGLSCSFNPYMTPEQMSFSNVAPRYVEGWFWNRFADRTIALTLETPYTCYLFNPEGDWVTRDNLAEFGRRVLQAIVECLEISTPGRIIVETPENPGYGWEKLGQEYSRMGDNAWMAIVPGVEMKYHLDNLEAGQYDLYKFVPGRNVSPVRDEGEVNFEPGVHGWQYVGTVNHQEDGQYNYSVEAGEFGAVADALLLIKKNE